MKPFQRQRATDISWSIRKLQRGLRVEFHSRYPIKEEGWQRSIIEQIERLKDELEDTIGTRTPITPKWPR
jgi:hypothetical protein